MPRGIVAALFVCLLVLGGAAFKGAAVDAPSSATSETSLDAYHSVIQRDYEGVRHIEVGELARLLQTSDTFLLFDVRTVEEYAVSRIPGAARIDPDISLDEFAERFAHLTAGKTLIFYCSIGVRSTALAMDVQSIASALGVDETAIVNLKGGIFAWHNQERPLVSAEGATEFVHPYNARWGKLLRRQGLLRYRTG